MAHKVAVKLFNSPESVHLLKTGAIPLIGLYKSVETSIINEEEDETDTEEEFDEAEALSTFELLKTFIKSGTRKSIESFKLHLQEHKYKDKIVNFQDQEGETLLHIGANEANAEIIQYLLTSNADPYTKDTKGRSCLHSVVIGKCRCQECSEKRVECIKCLLPEGEFADPVDNNGDTPIYYCAYRMYSACAKAFLDRGANLFHGTDKKNIATVLAEYLPEVLSYELDKCIGYDPEDSYKLLVDFRLLLQIRDQSSDLPQRETELLQSVLKARKGYDHVVTHPVVAAFLHFKWMVVRKFFFLIRSAYLFFVLLYTILMFRVYSNSCMDDCFFGSVGDLCKISDFDKISASILYGVVGLIAFSEFYKLYTDQQTYFSEGNVGILWWGLCILWGGTIIPVFGPSPLYYHYPIAAISVTYSWLMVLVQLGRMPWFAIHVGLLVKVIKDFLKLLATFTTVFIAFTLGFCVLLPQHEYYNNIPLGLFKSFMAMKGESDYNGILNKQSNLFLAYPEYSIPAHMMYAAFVIVVTMVLSALVVGQAVKDIGDAIKQAELNRSVRIIKEIGILEALTRNRIFTCCLTKYFCRWFSIERTKEIKGYQFSFSPVHPDDYTLPEDLKKSFLPYFDDCSCQLKKGRRPKN